MNLKKTEEMLNKKVPYGYVFKSLILLYVVIAARGFIVSFQTYFSCSPPAQKVIGGLLYIPTRSLMYPLELGSSVYDYYIAAYPKYNQPTVSTFFGHLRSSTYCPIAIDPLIHTR